MKLSDLQPGEYEVEEQQPSIDTPAPVAPKSSSMLKLSELDDYQIEPKSAAVTPEELYESESLAKKAYRLADVAGEGLLRGFKDEIQAGLETKLFPTLANVLGLASDEETEYLKSRYEPAKQQYEKFTEQTKEMMPRASYVAETGGALLPYLLARSPAGIAATIGLGAAEGAVTGAGKSKGDVTSGEFAKDVLLGAGLGSALGGVGTAAMKAAPKLTAGALMGAAATPALTGEVDPTQMGVGAGAGALLSALATKGKSVPTTTIGKLYEAGKQEKGLTGEKAIQEIVSKGAQVAKKVAEGTENISAASKGAADTIFTFFDDQIKNLGDVIHKGAMDTETGLNFTKNLHRRVWDDLQTHIKNFKIANPNKSIDVDDVIDTMTDSLRKAAKEKVTDPAEKQAVENTINIINDIAKTQDRKVTISKFMEEGLKSSSVKTKIEGVEDPLEREILKKLTPEELEQKGYTKTEGPFQERQMPKTTEETLLVSKDDVQLLAKEKEGKRVFTQKTASGKEPETILREKLETPEVEIKAPKEEGFGELEYPQTLISRTETPEQIAKTTKTVFERLFPGKSNLQNIDLSDISDMFVKLNDVYKNSKSDAVRRILANAKKELAKKEESLMGVEAAKDFVPRRRFYGEIKDAQETLSVESASDLFKLVDDIYSAQQKGSAQDFTEAFEAIRKISPEHAARLEDLLINKGATYKNLLANQKANPAKKLEVLKEEGIELPQSVQAAKKDIQEIRALEELAGTISEKTGLPTSKAYQFVEFLSPTAKKIYALDSQQVAEMQQATDIIKKRSPDLYKFLMSEGAEISEKIALAKILKGSGSDFGFFPTTAPGAIIKTGQVIGIPKAAYGFGRAVGKVSRATNTTTQKVKTILETPVGGKNFGKFQDPLLKAKERGDSALKATIYMLSQQFPEFRDQMNELEEAE